MGNSNAAPQLRRMPLGPPIARRTTGLRAKSPSET